MRLFPTNAAVIAAAICACMDATAQNLITNANFDTDVTGWSGPSTWFNEDCCGNPVSGSMRIQGGPLPGTGIESNCMEVLPNTAYDVVMTAKTLLGPGVDPASSSLEIIWYSDAACVTNLSFPYQYVLSASSIAGWRQLGAPVVSPASAQTAKVHIGAGGGGLSHTIDLYVDDMRFGPAGTVPVTLQSFDVE